MDFWDDMSGAYADAGMDSFLRGRELDDDFSRSLQNLTDKGRAANALKLPVEAGTRVRFAANLGAVLTYKDVPEDNLTGTVITVKTAEGNVPFLGEDVFVLWDDGQFRSIQAQHLRLAPSKKKQAKSVRRVVADMGDLGDFFKVAGPAGQDNELVHRATKDLWSFREEGGNFVIERLFDTDGTPLKV